MRPGASLLAAPLLSACAQAATIVAPAVPPRPNLAAVTKALSNAAGQVQPCYRSPKLNRMARQIVTTLHVAYTPDGLLANSPVVSRQEGVTESNRIYAGQMARAAIEAVERCVPLRLPADLYQNGWNEFDLTFSPRGLA